MPRTPRKLLVVENSTNHCTWQAHNYEYVLDADGARDKLLELIAKYKKQHGIVIRSYCLMGTHPHVVCTSTLGQEDFSKFWKVVNHGFACWYNRRHNRRGQVVMERMRSPRIQDDRHVLRVMRYGDLNPVRAGLVRRPKDWRWSSYRHYAFGEKNELIDDAPEYLALGRTPAARRIAYQALFASPLSVELRQTRREFVMLPFIGDELWVEARLGAAGLLPRKRGPDAFT